MLADTTETLARTARELKGIAPDEWLTFKEAAAYLKKTPKAFEKVVAQGELYRGAGNPLLEGSSWTSGS